MTAAPKTRKCGKCGKRKPLETGFHRNGARKDGRQLWCRICMNAIMLKVTRAKAAELRAFRLLKVMIAVAEDETR